MEETSGTLERGWEEIVRRTCIVCHSKFSLFVQVLFIRFKSSICANCRYSRSNGNIVQKNEGKKRGVVVGVSVVMSKKRLCLRVLSEGTEKPWNYQCLGETHIHYYFFPICFAVSLSDWCHITRASI